MLRLGLGLGLRLRLRLRLRLTHLSSDQSTLIQHSNSVCTRMPWL